jgi:hypothetical protein
MNRSIAQKILLVIVLVTIMNGGTLAGSEVGTAKPSGMQMSGPMINGVSDAISDHWQTGPGNACPFHRNVSHKNVPASGGAFN